MRRRVSVWLVAAQLLVATACAGPAAAPTPSAASTPAAPAPAAQAPAAQAPASTSAAPTTPPQRQSIRYGYVPIVASAAMYLAQERGYFTEQGIDLDMQSFDSGALMPPALSAGQLEAGHGTPGPALFNALARAVDIKTVASISYNGTQLMVRKDLADQIHAVPDLKGKRISFMVEGSPIDLTMRRVLYQNGMTLQDVDVQRLSMPDSAAALANGGLDAAAVVEPFPVLIETRGVGSRPLDVQGMVWQDEASIMLAGPSLLGRGDAAVTAFLVGFMKGMRDFQGAQRDHKLVDPAVTEIVSRWTNIPVEVLAQAVDSGAPPNNRIDLDDLNRQQDFWAQEGLVQSKADLANFVEYKYLDAAVPQVR
ncbi:MAG TPA: ABC transporter substrate-binding protein [Chloroflexota bacterium]|nr:ABC transporter substrate-binding protein [Chloroflexota bacterium]